MSGNAPKLIIEELNQADEVVERAKRTCHDLASASGDTPQPVTKQCTWLEAFATIQKREDDRRKSTKQEGKKQKKTLNENAQFRGTRIGVDPEVSAFWMVMEDYCRPVQAGDLQLLLPQHDTLSQDTAFFMPPLGFNPTQDEAPETEDGHDAATPTDLGQDQAAVQTASVTVKADPVDSTMHELGGGPSHEPAWEQHNTGPTLLHGAPVASMVTLLQLMASMFPAVEGDDSWQELADAAAKEEGTVLEPQLVERIRSCISKLQTSEAASNNSGSKAGSAALKDYVHALSCTKKESLALESVSDADSARAAVQNMLQSCVDATAARAAKVLPQIDAASALAGADQAVGLDADAVAAPELHKETAAPDQMVHPYLQGHLENVVLVEPALQQGRKSPSLAAAPGTPVASHPDAARAPTAAPTEPSTPAANGIDPSSVCADPLQDKGAEGDPGQETVVDDGNHVPDTAQPSHADTQEPSVDCSSMAYSMDCSTDVKDAPWATPGPADSSGPKAVQQRRSSRKRNRQERDEEGASAAKPRGKRAGTPHGTTSVRESSVSKLDTGKGTDVSDVPGEETPALAEGQETSVNRRAPTKRGRSKGGAKGAKAAAKAAASCDSERAHVQIKAEPKTSAAAPVTEKESSAPNGAAAAAGAAAPVDQEHDSSLLSCAAQEQWVTLNGALGVLAIAPDDEVVAEIISLQAELLQVTAANRKRCSTVLKAVLDDLPAQAEKQARQNKSEKEMDAFLVHVRALKRQAKLEKREAERKEAAEALATAEAAGGAGAIGGVAATAVTGRARRTAAQHANLAHASDDEDDDEDSEEEVGGVPLPLAGDSLVDPYALEVPDASDARCAVCGDGESNGSDQIVFCDRCNVAVHQNCYGVADIPQGEWLCWPCRMYEDQLKAEGKCQDDIRPPRYKESGIPDYPAGSKTVVCELCPMKRGVFKQTVEDGSGEKKWAHVVCALWQTPDVTVASANKPDVISGLENIRADHVCMTCAYCRQRTGATVKCAHPKCHTTFHPLCARKVGCFSLCRHNPSRGRPVYKTWCAQHSDAAKRRERDAPTKLAPANGEKRATGGPKQPQLVPDMAATREEVAALEAQLKAKNDALQFLQGVRYDLESARILAAQVEKREKGKMHVVDLLKQEYEMVLANPADFAPYEQLLGCRRHHHDLVTLMQKTFEEKRQKARRQFVVQQQDMQQRQQQHMYMQQQQQQQHAQQQHLHQQRMHQVDQMPGMRQAPGMRAGPGMPGSPGQMMYGQHRSQPFAPVHAMRMGGQVQGQAERMSQPQQFGMQHGSMLGGHGGFGGGMMPGGTDNDSLLRGLGGFDQHSNSPLVSPSSMLDPAAPQGGAHMMGRDGRFPQPQGMPGVNRMPLDRGGGGSLGSVGGGAGMGASWQNPTHLHGFNSLDVPSDHGLRSMHSAGGAGQDMMQMNANSFGMRVGDMARQHTPDHNLGRMPLAGADRGLSQMHEPPMMPAGGHLHGMPRMGNGQQQYRVQQMRASDPAGFGSQQRQQGGMAFMPQHTQDPGIQQQQQGGFGANAPPATAPEPPTTGRLGGRSQRAAAQAARGTSFANAADPFSYMDD